jgi:hypothetical protein
MEKQRLFAVRVPNVDDFITTLHLAEPEIAEAEAIKLLWAAIDEMARFGVRYEIKRNAVTGYPELVLEIEKVPALQSRTVYRVKSPNEK